MRWKLNLRAAPLNYRAPMPAAFDVRYTAQLARLNLTDAEIAKFQTQLGDVLAHVERLSAVDLTNVEPTAHANKVVNVFRADEAHPWFTAAEALSNAPRSANQLFIVPKVIE